MAEDQGVERPGLKPGKEVEEVPARGLAGGLSTHPRPLPSRSPGASGRRWPWLPQGRQEGDGHACNPCRAAWLDSPPLGSVWRLVSWVLGCSVLSLVPLSSVSEVTLGERDIRLQCTRESLEVCKGHSHPPDVRSAVCWLRQPSACLRPHSTLSELLGSNPLPLALSLRWWLVIQALP